MIQLVCGNIVALIASTLMVCCGIIKDRKKTIYVQTIQILAFVMSNLILGGYTGAIVNFISLARNYWCYKDNLTKIKKLILIILTVVFSLLFNNLGFIGLLPIIASVVFVCFIDTKSIIKLKILIAFTCILWLIYDILLGSYTSAAFNFFTILGAVITIFQLSHKK